MIVVDHLWQSLVCAALAAVAAAALRNAPARVRHGIWAAASAKFLLPLVLLEMLGRSASSMVATAPLPAAPWLDGSLHLSTFALTATGTDATRLVTIITALLVAAWSAGTVRIAWTRWREWRALAELAGSSRPLRSGREADALRGIAQKEPHPRNVRLLACDAVVEPVVLGIRSPMILWPAALSARLTDAELHTALAHELCHIRRRDNLVGLLHVVVEVLFWWNPVVWWIGARLVAERERACDEEVLAMGADNDAYAHAIVKVCRFGLPAPRWMAGIGGPGLVTRIERILDNRPVRRPSALARLAGAAIVVCVTAAPIAAGALDASRAGANPTIAAPQEAEPSRPGNAVTAPRLLREVKPVYTREARANKIQGRVVMEVVVLDDGTVGDVKVTESLDTEYGLDAEAVKAVKQWLFTPGTKYGKPVPVKVDIEMTFTLKD
jgi:TonB family protein